MTQLAESPVQWVTAMQERKHGLAARADALQGAANSEIAARGNQSLFQHFDRFLLPPGSDRAARGCDGAKVLPGRAVPRPHTGAQRVPQVVPYRKGRTGFSVRRPARALRPAELRPGGHRVSA